MASGLEQRVPFLNNELMELSFRIPARYKIGLKTGKKIFKETFADILPPDILYAKKRGYLTPASKWLLEPRWQKYLRQVLSKEEITKHGLFNATGIEKMIKNHTNLQKHNANLIWAMLTFQIWYNQVKPLI
jgi:asparagine synthase (glutamine-hydrolysing)